MSEYRRIAAQGGHPLPPGMIQTMKKVLAAFHENPGHSDLDREQPINITVELGTLRDLRFAISLLENP